MGNALRPSGQAVAGIVPLLHGAVSAAIPSHALAGKGRAHLRQLMVGRGGNPAGDEPPRHLLRVCLRGDDGGP